MSTDKKVFEVFNTRVGIEILAKELARASGENIDFGKIYIGPGTEYRIKITRYAVYRAGGSVYVLDFLSLERATKVIEFLKKEKPYDLYQPWYYSDTYFNIKEDEFSIDIDDICKMLEKLGVDLAALAKKNHARLTGEKFGL